MDFKSNIRGIRIVFFGIYFRNTIHLERKHIKYVKGIVWKVGVKMEYKYFIMEILNDLYLIREDIKNGPGYEAIAALINKIESRSVHAIEPSKDSSK